jgi:hypothetical protein
VAEQPKQDDFVMKLVIPSNENELINNFFDGKDVAIATEEKSKNRSYEIQCKILSINKLIK